MVAIIGNAASIEIEDLQVGKVGGGGSAKRFGLGSSEELKGDGCDANASVRKLAVARNGSRGVRSD